MRIFKILSKFNPANIMLFALAVGAVGLIFGSTPALAEMVCPANNICGTVTDTNGTGISGVPVEAFAPGSFVNDGMSLGQILATTVSGSGGSYTLSGLAPASYVLVFNDFTNSASKPNYAWQYYGGQHKTENATPVTVVSGQPLIGIDASLLPAGGSIHGVVTNLSDTPLLRVLVIAYSTSDGIINHVVTSSAMTDTYGNYTITQLPTGNYYLLFKAQYSTNYVSQLYDGKNGLMMWMQQSALPVPATDGQPPTQANLVRMSLAGTVSGYVTDPTTNTPAANIGVTVYFATPSVNDIGSPAWNTKTDNLGHYATTGLPAGSYWVEFNGRNSSSYKPDYPTLFYGQVQNISTTVPTPLTVNESLPTPANMSLTRLIPSNTTITSSASSATVGQEVTYTVTVSPGNTSSGRVTMYDSGQLLPGCAFNMINNGIVICHVTYVSAGTHSITARYHDGDVYGESASAPLVETITGSASDLMSANLVGANLSGANLAGFNLNGLNLTGANLTSANLEGVNLKNATLTGVDFTNSNLTNAELKNTTLVGADLSGADLSYADLKGVNLSNVNLSDANLTSADFKSANLTNATLTGANLTGADFKNAILTDVIY